MTRRAHRQFLAVAVSGAALIVFGLVRGPGFTDVFYHLNAATRWAQGAGLTDPYLWTYIGAPDSLPAPSHLYWMPLTALASGLSMKLLGQVGSYAAAQVPLFLAFVALCYVGFRLGWRLGGGLRQAWVAGLLTLFSGYYVRFWGAVDTFALYALWGSLTLWALGSLGERPRWQAAALAGVGAGLAHLTRADGVLLLLVGYVVLAGARAGWRASLRLGAVLTGAYLLTMLPWFARNLSVIGAAMPLGGTQALWFRAYDDIFNYPPQASPATLLADGFGALFASRWLALTQNVGTFVAVEGLVVLTPLMLFGWWRRRGQPLVRGFAWYALGLHLAMTFAFPFPGYRGGLLHSAAALVPWWAALGVVGLDEAIEWVAQRRRAWRPATAKRFFSVALVGVGLFLSVLIGGANCVPELSKPGKYAAAAAVLPADARVLANDPAQFYYLTGRGGVVLPNAPIETLLEIAQRYQIDYVLIEDVLSDGTASNAAPAALWPLLTNPPDFLMPIPINDPEQRLYAIHR